MRKHGWELPYHPLQVVAIAVFISLAFAFYVFFIPFLGSKVLQYHVVALFSPLVLVVFALYIRCAAANPADPGIDRCSKEYGKCSKKSSGKFTDASNDADASAKSSRCCFSGGLALCLRRCFCSGTEKPQSQDDLLYCSLCEAEIFKFSKHCRACDKCVEGFDHHCRWINNCIGRKNYRIFVSLMVSSLLLLVLEWGVGIFVIIRCLLHKQEFEDDIVSKLGTSFSLVPFVVVVALCTLLAMMATIPLGQLFFFHLILIHKGISTYDYIVAMRERHQLGDASSQSSTMSSSPTVASGTSSLGILQTKPWCTPPRMFLEQQDTGIKSSLPDIEQSKDAPALKQNVKKKKPVKISAWKLARLSAEDASRASERARGNSSVLRPIGNDTAIVTETDNSSNEEGFGKSPANEIVPVPRKSKRKRDFVPPGMPKPSSKAARDRKHDATKAAPGTQDAGDSIAPLQLEAQSAFWPTSSKTLVPALGLLSPDEGPNTLSGSSPGATGKAWLQRSVSDGYEASGGESADDSEHGRKLWSRLKQSSSFVNKSSLKAAVTGVASQACASDPTASVFAESSKMGSEVLFSASPDEDFNSSRYNSPEQDSDFSRSHQHA